MTILSYQIFKTVTEMGSFQKAAEVLGLTPSAISHAVSAMERELGFTVFTRSKTGVTPTSYGEQLLPYINGVLNSEESFRQAVSEIGGLKQGKVKVGCFASACIRWMPETIRAFAELYPAIRIEVYQGTYDDVRYWIRSGIVDFGFLSASSARDLPLDVFYEDPLVCVVPENFRKDPATEKMTIAEMSRHQFVVQRESTDADIQKYMKQNQLEVRADYHVVDDLPTVAMVASGLGICIMPELVMNDIPYEVPYYGLDPGASRLIGLSVPDKRYMAPAVRTLYQYILDTYRNTETTAP